MNSTESRDMRDFTQQDYNNLLHIVTNKLTPALQEMEPNDYSVYLYGIKFAYEQFIKHKKWLKNKYRRLVRDIDDNLRIEVMNQQLIYTVEGDTTLSEEQKQKQLEEIKNHFDLALEALTDLWENYNDDSEETSTIGAGFRRVSGHGFTSNQNQSTLFQNHKKIERLLNTYPHNN